MINTGKVITDNFKDIPDHLRLNALSFYLIHAYPKSDFKYICLHHTDDITESFKLSSNLKLKIKVNGSEDDTYNINKKGEHSTEFNNTFLLRLEPRHKTGVNEVHIKKEVFKKALLSLDQETLNNLDFLLKAGKNDISLKYGSYKKGIAEFKRLLNVFIDVMVDC